MADLYFRLFEEYSLLHEVALQSAANSDQLQESTGLVPLIFCSCSDGL